MPPWPRLRKAAKWVSAALLVFCIALGAFTSRWFIEWRSPDLSSDAGLLAWKGMVSISWGPAIPGFVVWEPPVGLSCGRSRSTLFPMESWRWKPDWVSSPYGSGMNLPLWLPASMALAAFLSLSRADWRVAKRTLSGQCRLCGYDRHGLMPDTPCPECGDNA